mmetsp:Transcript_119654/g.338751  ORF Transcript_119654/g.338751 Transcript_119654/m.338751 type:complete len:269 (+) Transcript_119654:1514-2320(+)
MQRCEELPSRTPPAPWPQALASLLYPGRLGLLDGESNNCSKRAGRCLVGHIEPLLFVFLLCESSWDSDVTASLNSGEPSLSGPLPTPQSVANGLWSWSGLPTDELFGGVTVTAGSGGAGPLEPNEPWLLGLCWSESSRPGMLSKRLCNLNDSGVSKSVIHTDDSSGAPASAARRRHNLRPATVPAPVLHGPALPLVLSALKIAPVRTGVVCTGLNDTLGSSASESPSEGDACGGFTPTPSSTWCMADQRRKHRCNSCSWLCNKILTSL